MLTESVFELLDAGVDSFPVRTELIIDNLVNDRSDMRVLLRLLDTPGHVLSIAVHFVDELIIIVKFLVEGLDYFLFLLEFVSQVVDFGLDVRLDHAADLLGGVKLSAFGLQLVGGTVVTLGTHELVRTQACVL